MHLAASNPAKAIHKNELANVHVLRHVHGIVNSPTSMNRKPISSAELVKALEARLRGLLGQVTWLRGWSIRNFPSDLDHGFDLLVTLSLPHSRPVDLWVQCKAEPRPSQFPYSQVVSKVPPEPVLVFAAPIISPRMAEVCRESGWSWFDLAGNCRIEVPGLLQLQHTGRAPVHQTPKPIANLSTPEAGRIIRALLLPENVRQRWTQRLLAEHFGKLEHPLREPSLGLVNKVIRHLREEAFIEQAPDGGFRLREPQKLLFVWRDAYRFDRHERRSCFTMLQGNKLRAALYRFGLQASLAAYASFSAADFQAPHVRQPKTWLYVPRQDLSALEEMVEVKTVDSGENTIVLIPDDEGVFYRCDGGTTGDQRMACTNTVQTYVDLWHSGGRGQEAAEALLEQRLKPEWKAKGLKV